MNADASHGRGGTALSAEEMAALAAGIEDGSVPVDTGYNLQARVVRHDLTSEDSTLGINLGSIDMINERFVRQVRMGLLGALRTSPRITPSRVKTLRFGEYLRMLKPPLSVNTVRMLPLRGFGLVVIEPPVIFSALDNFFGGFGRGVGQLPAGRMFTPTETRIINMMLGVLLGALGDAWAPVMQLEFSHAASEINPQFAQIADENDLVIFTRLEVDSGGIDARGHIDLVYPFSSLKPVRDLLRARVQTGDGDETSDRQWSEALQASVSEAALQLRVTVGEAQVSVGKLEQLREGDVIFFKPPPSALVRIHGVAAFEAEVGQVAAQVAIRIQQAIAPPKD